MWIWSLFEIWNVFEIWRDFLVQNIFFLRNHCLNEKCCIKCIRKGGHIKTSLQISFELWILVASTMQQNQIDLILLHVAGNKIYRQKCWNQDILLWRRWNIFMRFAINIFFLLSHQKIAPYPQSVTISSITHTRDITKSGSLLKTLIFEMSPSHRNKVICKANLLFYQEV